MIASTPGLDPSIEENQALFVFGTTVIQGVNAVEAFTRVVKTPFEVFVTKPELSNDNVGFGLK